ncbi:hypothetical protein F5Y11DRAFT_362352 [Daldinia sp. FL1419]|nr:hypothetical protein F5Y11DRAFT_362352 [Daldinia sp. FL1419]
MSASWPYRGDPSQGPPGILDGMVADVIHVLELLELPAPHAYMLLLMFRIAMFCGVVLWVVFVCTTIWEAIFVTLFRSLSCTETRTEFEPWTTTLLRLIDTHYIDNIATLSCLITTFTISLLKLAALVVISSNWLHALLWVAAWCAWVYFGWWCSEPMNRLHTLEGFRILIGRDVWLWPVLLIAVFMLSPRLNEQVDSGIVKIYQHYGSSSPGFLMNLADEILLNMNSPEVRRGAPLYFPTVETRDI